MMARWVVGVVMLAACGRSPVEGNSDDASSGVTGTTTQSSASTGVTATATATVTATDTNDTGGSATQGADDSSGASTEPTPTTGGPGSSGDETTVGVSGTSTGGPSTGAAETDTGPDTGTDTGADTSSTGEAETGSSSTSMGPDTDTDMPPQEGLWMVMLEDTSSPTRLYKIDLLDGHSTLLCALDTNNNYNTSTFGRDGTLYAANADTKNLEAIDPCTCKRTVLGPTKVDALPGITTDQALGLYGLETTVDQLMAISTMNGSATPVGPLGINWGTGGLTWSDDLKDAFAINGTDDRLYTINHLTGKATLLVQTDYNFGSVGIEWHPKSHEIFACSNPAELLRVEQKDGAVTVVGPMLLENKQAHCDNLAAPWVPVACVENK